jgi:hypothetical protein
MKKKKKERKSEEGEKKRGLRVKSISAPTIISNPVHDSTHIMPLLQRDVKIFMVKRSFYTCTRSNSLFYSTTSKPIKPKSGEWGIS